MSGLLGFIAGAGDAFQDVADRRLKMYDTAQLEQMKQQAEEMKLQREEESAKRLNIFNANLDLSKDQTLRHQKMAEETDPEYIKRLATAETTKQGLLDAYKYGNADQEAAYKRKMALASDIDHTDYAGRALSHKKLQLEIDKIRSGKSELGNNPADIQFIKDENTQEVSAYNKRTLETVNVTKRAQLAALQAAVANQNKSPEAPGPEKISREQRIRDLEKKYPNFDVRSSVANMSDTEITQKFEKSLREDEASSLKANQEKKKAVQDKQKAFEKQKEKDRRLESAARAEKKGSRYFGRRDSEY